MGGKERNLRACSPLLEGIVCHCVNSSTHAVAPPVIPPLVQALISQLFPQFFPLFFFFRGFSPGMFFVIPVCRQESSPPPDPISTIGIATLVYSLTGAIPPPTAGSMHQPCCSRYASWVLVCTLQLSACLWFVRRHASAYDDYGLGDDTDSLTKFIFFIGLHDTMIYWCRVIVRPIVDKTVLGFYRGERWWERAAVVVSFGGLWWWRLREDIEALMIMADVKRELLTGVERVELVSQRAYYLTVAIGMVRVVKACSHLGLCLISRSLKRRLGDGYYMIGFGVESCGMRCGIRVVVPLIQQPWF